MVIWLLGLSGAGKTTIGRKVFETVRQSHSNTVFIDGDLLRDVWGDSLGHTVEARRLNAHRISNLVKMLDAQGIHVVAAVMSMFPEWLAWNREQFSSYFEVFLDAPLEMLQSRDSKGLYRAASLGGMDNVVGVDIPYPRPENPDLVLSPSDLNSSPAELAEKILAAAAESGLPISN